MLWAINIMQFSETLFFIIQVFLGMSLGLINNSTSTFFLFQVNNIGPGSHLQRHPHPIVQECAVIRADCGCKIWRWGKSGGKKIWREENFEEKNMEVAKYEGGERLIGNFSYDLADNPTIRQSERIDVHCFQHFLCIRDYLAYFADHADEI